MANNKEDKTYNWDDVVALEENQYNLMPAGTVVDFTVEAIEKKRNAKLNCPSMDIKMKCVSVECGSTTVFESISLHSKAQYFINAFFTAIGFAPGCNKSIGQMAQEAIGRTGKAKLKVDSWEKANREGKVETYQANKIDRYLKRDEGMKAAEATGGADDSIF